MKISTTKIQGTTMPLQKHKAVYVTRERQNTPFYLNKFSKGFVGLFRNIETVCSDAVKKQDGNTCYKE